MYHFVLEAGCDIMSTAEEYPTIGGHSFGRIARQLSNVHKFTRTFSKKLINITIGSIEQCECKSSRSM